MAMDVGLRLVEDMVKVVVEAVDVVVVEMDRLDSGVVTTMSVLTAMNQVIWLAIALRKDTHLLTETMMEKEDKTRIFRLAV